MSLCGLLLSTLLILAVQGITALSKKRAALASTTWGASGAPQNGHMQEPIYGDPGGWAFGPHHVDTFEKHKCWMVSTVFDARAGYTESGGLRTHSLYSICKQGSWRILLCVILSSPLLHPLHATVVSDALITQIYVKNPWPKHALYLLHKLCILLHRHCVCYTVRVCFCTTRHSK